ncbi:carboxymuconolactone decarboxylase family protein [Rhizobium sp. BK456]|uniref:carboxymuconolactone decarboxylase family protein n=1 Tax=Rhizobium sp. BK456 TaxID=2587007 RepID=UPI0016163824|nr:carboxymuconolactone decarboxylase family protein [Rhizobium sp. BK456]MBB3527024.1 alkylhydroperoxidase/carboxymuconolactone decarboxylase family protein YurZ [Rhizobium sp. BK456]
MLERLHDTVMHPLYRRSSLPQKFKHILMVSLNAFQFHHGGVSGQTKAALEAGASKDEILEALEIVSLSNLHGMSTALPLVVEEFENFKNRAGEDGGGNGR